MNTSMLLYLVTGNPIFLIMNGGSNNMFLMLYLMGMLPGMTPPATGGGAVQTSAAGTLGNLTSALPLLLLSKSGRRRSYRRRRNYGSGNAYTRGLINGMARTIH